LVNKLSQNIIKYP